MPQLSPKVAVRLLTILRDCGNVLGGIDHAGLEELRRRGHASVEATYSTTRHRTRWHVWRITPAGTRWLDAQGAPPSDEQQVDLEQAIAATRPEPRRRPVSAPRPVPDAPAVPAAGVSAPQGRSSGRAADRQRGARGHQPETDHA